MRLGSGSGSCNSRALLPGLPLSNFRRVGSGGRPAMLTSAWDNEVKHCLRTDLKKIGSFFNESSYRKTAGRGKPTPPKTYRLLRALGFFDGFDDMGVRFTLCRLDRGETPIYGATTNTCHSKHLLSGPQPCL